MLTQLNDRSGSHSERAASANDHIPLTRLRQPSTRADRPGLKGGSGMNRKLFLAGLVVGAVVGCSSPNRVSPALLPSPVPSVVKSGTDQQVAQAAVLNQQDMGPDYRATSYPPDVQDTADDAAFKACLGRPSAATHDTARAFSPTFTEDFQVIEGSITLVDSTQTAQADIAALRDTPRTVSCFQNLLTTQLSRSGGSAQVEVNQINPPPGGPDGDAVAYRLRILAQAGGQTIPIVMDVVNAVKGRAETSVSLQNFNHPVPADLEDRAVRAMLDRLPNQ